MCKEEGGGGYYTIVRPLIRLAHRLPAGQFVSGLRSCQSKRTSSPQAVATEHLSCCVERFDGGTLLCVDPSLLLRCNPHTHTHIHTRTAHNAPHRENTTHACNASVKNLDAHARREHACEYFYFLYVLHVWRGGTSRRLRGCLSFRTASPPYVTLINRRHVESHQD